MVNTIKPQEFTNDKLKNRNVLLNNIKHSPIMNTKYNMSTNLSMRKNRNKYNTFINSLDNTPNVNKYIIPSVPRLVRSTDYKRKHLEFIVSLNSFNYNKYYSDEFKESFNKKYLTSKSIIDNLNDCVPLKKDVIKEDAKPIPPPLLCPQPKYITIERDITDINDLLSIIEDYPLEINSTYNINLPALHNIKHPLRELNDMIGMKELKENIVDQILFYVQNLHNGTNDFMHTCIYGPPGTGKTEIAKIMGKIFSNLGVLKNKTFEKVKERFDCHYLGKQH